MADFPYYSTSKPKTLIQKLDDLGFYYPSAQELDQMAEKITPGREEDEIFSGSLSTSHKRRKGIKQGGGWFAESYTDGGLLSVKQDRIKVKQLGGGKRGMVHGFSRGSRRRLLRNLAKLKRAVLPVFVTLTYAEYPDDQKVWKNDLVKFLKKLKYRFPEACGVWKLEFQDRGAPHYHLFVYGVDLYDLMAFVPLAWYEIAGQENPDHLIFHNGGFGNEHCVQKLKSYKQAMIYASKYIGKVDDGLWANPGRIWGMFGRKFIPYANLDTIAITEKQAHNLLRYMRRYAHLKGRDYIGLTVLCNKPERWIQSITRC